MAQQTAVEWLVEEINKHKAWADPSQLEPLIEQAKQMEKQQLIETWKHGNLPTFLGRVLTAEQYYNKTYNK
jgi:hypothetical protein